MKKLSAPRLIVVLAAVLSISFLPACSSSAVPPAPSPAGLDSESSSGSGDILVPRDVAPIIAGQSQMIARDGNISLVVADVIAARDGVTQMATRLEGYVISSSVSGDGSDMRGNITFRVPPQNFEQALAEIRKMGSTVLSETTSSEDVTEEYVDLDSRLTSAEAMEKQYLTLLEGTKDVNDILRIYQELGRIRSEIEQLKGKMQYLERISAMSLIKVNLYLSASARPITVSGWDASGTLKAATRGLLNFLKVFASVAIWLLIFIPVWGTPIAIVWWVRRRRNRRAIPKGA